MNKFNYKLASIFAVCVLSLVVMASCSKDKDDEDDVKYPIVTGEEFATSGQIDGYDYTDLGLSVKWSSMDFGASSQKEEGASYLWGDTNIKHGGYVRNVYYITSVEKEELYAVWRKYYSTDMYSCLDSLDDIAYVNMGSHWRLPSKADFQELVDKCTWTVYSFSVQPNADSKSIMSGYKVTGPNGNSIFILANLIYESDGMGQVTRMNHYWTSDIISPSRRETYSFLDYMLTGDGFNRIKIDESNVCRVRPVAE